MTGWVLAWNGNLDRYDPGTCRIGDVFPWSMGRNFPKAERPEPGDPYLLWRAGRRAGVVVAQVVVAQGVVVRSQYTDAAGTRWMGVRLDDDTPIHLSRAALRADPVLTNNGSFVDCGLFHEDRKNRGMNPYRLTDSEWTALTALI